MIRMNSVLKDVKCRLRVQYPWSRSCAGILQFYTMQFHRMTKKVVQHGIQSIDGVKYEKELLDLAKKHTTGRGEGKISKQEVADLFKSATDGQGVTETEKRTLEYIRSNFDFTDAAAKDFNDAFARL